MPFRIKYTDGITVKVIFVDGFKFILSSIKPTKQTKNPIAIINLIL